MNEILVIFLFAIFMLISFVAIGFSMKNQIIILIVVVLMLIVFTVFILYMRYVTKLANDKIKNNKDFNSFKLFINYILTSEVDLRLSLDKDTAIQIMKIINKEIYTVKDIFIYDILDDKYTAETIRNELLEELEYLDNKNVYKLLKMAYNDLNETHYISGDMTLIWLDTWCIQQVMHMRSRQTSKVAPAQLDALQLIIESINEIKIDEVEI